MTGRLAGGLWPVAVLGAILAVAACTRDEMPEASDGRALFLEYCSVCHGDAGAGDGPAGIGLEPPPANLRDAARLDRLSLYDLYNTLGLGIEGTDMPAFADQLDDRQRWDLASYIAGFSAAPAQGGTQFRMADLAGRTPAEIVAEGGDGAAFRRFRADMANRKTGRAAGEAAIGDEGNDFSQAFSHYGSRG